MLKKIVKFFKDLNANSHPGEVAHAICCAMILGFMPKNNLLWFVIFFLLLFVRINKSCYLLFTFLISQITPFLDPIFNSIGLKILLYKPFESVFVKMLDIPFVPLTKFNNTIVIGSLASGLALYIPIYIILRLFISVWRKSLAPSLAETKFVKMLAKAPLISKIITTSKELSL